MASASRRSATSAGIAPVLPCDLVGVFGPTAAAVGGARGFEVLRRRHRQERRLVADLHGRLSELAVFEELRAWLRATAGTVAGARVEAAAITFVQRFG